MADTIAPPQTCRNCAAALAGPYCAQCGQKDRPLNPSLFSLAGDALAEMFDVNGRLLRSIRLLFTRPGFLTNELLAGRRASYVSPLRLYLVFSLILFAVSTLVANRALVMPSHGNTIYLGMGASINWGERPGDRERTMAQAQRMIETRAVWLPRAMFVVVPVMALFVMVLTWGSRRHYPDHLQFTTHVQAVAFASFALVVGLPQLPPGDIAEVWKAAWGLALVRTAIPVAILSYVLIAFRNVYGGGWLLNALRTLVISLLFGVMFIAAGNAILMYGFRDG